jgi:hypothetical protein
LDCGGDIVPSFGRQAFQDSLKTNFETPHELEMAWRLPVEFENEGRLEEGGVSEASEDE